MQISSAFVKLFLLMKEGVEEKIKVLLIEDEKEVAELYRLKLSLDGYEVITAENGEEGLERAFSEKPDLIFLDIGVGGTVYTVIEAAKRGFYAVGCDLSLVGIQKAKYLAKRN